jgi:histidinol dehydrogenase
MDAFMRTYHYPNKEIWADIVKRPIIDSSKLQSSVNSILNEVKRQGDKAIKRLSKQYDHIMLDYFQVTDEEFIQAIQSVDSDFKKAVEKAYENIEKFHGSQREAFNVIETSPGVKCWRTSTAIDKVGLYIPGGTAPLFSTVLMLGIPSKLAGCSEIILCTPPDKRGLIHAAILFCAQLVGINRVYKVGGAQAIAAMAYGTETISKVDKIFGPGNQYVTMAKQLVSLEGVAIDMPAGPSEVAVVADQTGNPEFIAADLLSQAEHGIDSQVIFITTKKTLLEHVQDALRKQLESLPRKEIAETALNNSNMILLQDIDQAVELINNYAPEHLILMVKEPEKIIDKIQNAGSVFLGLFTPESAGDYASGTNHTLPTNGMARSYSGVSLDSFIKKITFQEISVEGLAKIGSTIEKMAETEGLIAHKRAVEIRLQSLKKRYTQ